MYSYTNNNYTVTIQEDGTKIREYDSIPNPIFPESIDLKITNQCNLGCPYCHENSYNGGKHADLNYLLSLLKPLPAGVEIAVGGGSALSHPDLVPFLENLRSIGLIPNLTINSLHLKEYKNLLDTLLVNNLIFGLGISYNDSINLEPYLTDNSVIHLILGVHTIGTLNKLTSLSKTIKILLLGYKTFGRGYIYEEMYSRAIRSNIYDWYTNLHTFFNKENLILSFDNLAIKQLNLRRFFSEKDWTEFYMGNDGDFTMYIDGVEKAFAASSANSIIYKIEDKTIFDIFKYQKNRKA